MSRINIRQIYMRLAWMFSQRSTCERLHVGCVIVDDDYMRVLAVGYNGNYAGGDNTCDSNEPGNCGCLHAEDNACLKLDYSKAFESIAFITHSPCKMCAKRLINAGVHAVYYTCDYRSAEGLYVLKAKGMIIEKITVPESYMEEYINKMQREERMKVKKEDDLLFEESK